MKKRILIAAHDSAIRNLLVELLSDMFFVNAIDDVAGARIHCKTQNYSIVIVDNTMSKDRRGIDFVPQIRMAREEMKIILMSGGGISENEAITAGADTLISKPFLPNMGTAVVQVITGLLEEGD